MVQFGRGVYWPKVLVLTLYMRPHPEASTVATNRPSQHLGMHSPSWRKLLNINTLHAKNGLKSRPLGRAIAWGSLDKFMLALPVVRSMPMGLEGLQGTVVEAPRECAAPF
jgi:hypothetical protein